MRPRVWGWSILTGQLISRDSLGSLGSLDSLGSAGIRRRQQRRKFCASFENNNNSINGQANGRPCGGWELMSLPPLSDMFSRSGVSLSTYKEALAPHKIENILRAITVKNKQQVRSGYRTKYPPLSLRRPSRLRLRDDR